MSSRTLDLLRTATPQAPYPCKANQEAQGVKLDLAPILRHTGTSRSCSSRHSIMAGVLRLNIRLQGTWAQQPLTVALKEVWRQDHTTSRRGMAILAGTPLQTMSSKSLVLSIPPCHTETLP